MKYIYLILLFSIIHLGERLSQQNDKVRISDIFRERSYLIFSRPPYGYDYVLKRSLEVYKIKNVLATKEYFYCKDSLSSNIIVDKGYKITLTSGLIWEQGDEPKKQHFLLFRRAKMETINYVNFLKFKRISETNNKLACEMLNSIIISIEFVNEERERCKLVNYKLIPDSNCMLKIIDKEILP